MSEPSVSVEVRGGVATLWLNRPAKRNAVTLEMWWAIADAATRLGADPRVRLLVLRGRGEHFCAGADIGDVATTATDEHTRANRAADDAVAAFPKPTVAVITGACVGGGAELAIACDLRLADRTARFGITPARLGIVYPDFAVARAVRLLGPSATKHLLYTAELIDAERALRIGLVDEIHEPGDLPGRVDKLVHTLCSRSLMTQMASKAVVDAVVDGAGPDGERLVALSRAWAEIRAASPDPAEGIAAFTERRDPTFTWTP